MQKESFHLVEFSTFSKQIPKKYSDNSTKLANESADGHWSGAEEL